MWCIFWFGHFILSRTAAPGVDTLSLHDALPISPHAVLLHAQRIHREQQRPAVVVVSVERSEEHTSELQSRLHLVCRLLLEKKTRRRSRSRRRAGTRARARCTSSRRSPRSRRPEC